MGSARFNRGLLVWLAPFRWPVIAAVIADVLIAALIVIQAFLLASVIDRVYRQRQDLSEIRDILGVFLLLGVTRLGMAFFQQIKLSRTGTGLKRDLRRHLMTQIYENALPAGTADFISLYNQQVDAVVRYLVDYLPQLARAAAIPLIILIFVFPVDLLSATVFLITAPLIPLFMMLIGGITETVTRRKWRSLSQMNAFFLDVLKGLTTIKIFGRIPYFLERINQSSESFRTRSLQVLRIAFLSALVMELLTTLSTAVIAVEIGLRLLYGQLPFADALFVLLLAPDFYQPMRQLGSRFHIAVAGLTAAEKYPLLCHPPAREFSPEQNDHPGSPGAGLKFENVSCRYPGRTGPVLTDITIDLPSPGLVVIVGPSGAGKSTLLSLILRFAPLSAGRIMTGDQPITDLSPEIWRRRIAWISQDPYLFNRTVRENIAMARPEAASSAITAAAAKAQLEQVVNSLPEGYDTGVGERGSRLSAGERQRLALARVFLRDSPLVLLDEPTASLDAQTDALIRDSVITLARDRMVLVVSHRPEILSAANLVIMLAQGCVTAAGRHSDLIKENRRYGDFIGRGDE